MGATLKLFASCSLCTKGATLEVGEEETVTSREGFVTIHHKLKFPFICSGCGLAARSICKNVTGKEYEQGYDKWRTENFTLNNWPYTTPLRGDMPVWVLHEQSGWNRKTYTF